MRDSLTLKTSEQGKGEIEGTKSKKTERLLPNVKGRGETHNRGRRRRDMDGQRWSDREQKCSDCLRVTQSEASVGHEITNHCGITEFPRDGNIKSIQH